MLTLALIGLVGGLVAGISPCILPVLPIIFMSATSTSGDREAQTGRDWTPYAVVAGLALSFSVFTLLGTLLLSALPVPQDVIRWAGLVVLVLLGVSMIVPPLERVIERPFARLRVGNGGVGRSGFVLGLALGAVYVPCAGPVLAAIAVAGATGEIGGSTIVLTVAFAVGTSIPLLALALAGRRIGERIRAFREHQRTVRIAAGVVVLALAVALTFNVTDLVQRAVPDYTASLAKAVDPGTSLVHGRPRSRELRACEAQNTSAFEDCGPAPKVTGIQSWLNTPGNRPLLPSSYAGKVVLVDFWAYSCINCQRAIPHVEAWWQKYAKDGLEVIGVHTPEYAFEHVPANVAAGTRRLGITYPVALDGDYSTWNSFGNDSWPADYLIDSSGEVRNVRVGEGDYAGSEALIRELLQHRDPHVRLPAPTDLPDTTPTTALTPETYLGYQRAAQWIGPHPLRPGTRTYHFPRSVPSDRFALSGSWSVHGEDIVAGRHAAIALAYTGMHSYLDVGGTGTLRAVANGRTKRIRVSGAPDIYPVLDLARAARGVLLVRVPPGLHCYSFTFG